MSKKIENEEVFSIPLNVSEILELCQKFSNLGFNIQHQLQDIAEYGVEESIKRGLVKKESLPFIQDFLSTLSKNSYLGDAAMEAETFLFMLKELEPPKRNLLSLN